MKWRTILTKAKANSRANDAHAQAGEIHTILINRILGREIIEQGEERVVVECPIRLGGALWCGNDRRQREAVGKPLGQPIVHELLYIVATLAAPVQKQDQRPGLRGVIVVWQPEQIVQANRFRNLLIEPQRVLLHASIRFEYLTFFRF
jgi:hypothetical protein